MNENAFPQLRFVDRRHWRQWLSDNATSRGVWVLRSRRGAHRRLSYGEIVEEALCFGWTTTLRGRTEETGDAKFLLAPRTPGSVWSAIDKRRVEDLLARAAMHERGLYVVAAAQRDGSWRAMDGVEDLL